MRITFVSFGPLYRNARGKVTSDLASTRYRALLPARYLAGRGHEVQMVTSDESFWSEAKYAQITGEAVVFGKSLDERNESVAVALRNAGRRVIFDICDNHFDTPTLGAHYRRMIELADDVVASTQTMADIVRSVCGREARVIFDPLEGNRSAVRFATDHSPVRLMWFGHPLNLDTLRAVMPELQSVARDRAISLAVVTSPGPWLEQEREFWSNAANLKVTPINWSMEAMEQQFAACDIVIIPSLSNDRKNVKSPNRLTESIWAGRLAIAYPIPSYLEFADYAVIATDFDTAIRDALASPQAHVARIAEGQEYLAQTYSVPVIGDQWERLFLSPRSTRRG